MQRSFPRRTRLLVATAVTPAYGAGVSAPLASQGPLLAKWSRPALDGDRLDELHAVLGSERVMQLLILFGRQLATQPGMIRDAVGRSDLTAAAAEAHSLKGAALSIGGASVGHAAALLEQALSGVLPHGSEQLHQALRTLDGAVAATVAALPREVADEPLRAA